MAKQQETLVTQHGVPEPRAAEHTPVTTHPPPSAATGAPTQSPPLPVPPAEPALFYPAALAQEEIRALKESRQLRAKLEGGPQPIQDTSALPRDGVGAALSGGGIRSATFCLGLFQGLARDRLLRRIDFLSTVSGGGYFGSFLGRMFTREWIGPKRGNEAETPTPTHAPLKQVAPDSVGAARVEAVLTAPHSAPMRWLRDNGRYMSPNGSGSTLLMVAVVLRNWLAVSSVLAVTVFTVFAGLNWLRAVLWRTLGWTDSLEQVLAEASGHWLWFSPLIVLPLVTLFIMVIPSGWAYWLTQGEPLRTAKGHAGSAPSRQARAARARGAFKSLAALVPIVAIIGMGVAFYASTRSGPLYQAGGLAVTLMGGLTILCWLVALARAGKHADQRHLAVERSFLSKLFAWALLVTGVLAAVAFVDSLAQSCYAVLQYGGWSRYSCRALTAASGLTVLVMVARNLVMLVQRVPGTRKFQLPLNAVSAAAALVLAAGFLVSVVTVAHGFAWSWRLPQPEFRDADGKITAVNPGQLLYQSAPAPEAKAEPDAKPAAPVPVPPESTFNPKSRMSLRRLGGAVLVGLGLTLAFGCTLPFLNQSSHHALYAARLCRAFQGASNPQRWQGKGQRVDEVMDDDDTPLPEYRPHERGGPLHLINVTVNETVSGRYQIEFRDRQGLPMCVGPGGISVGNDHALWGRADQDRKFVQPRTEDTGWVTATGQAGQITDALVRAVQASPHRFHALGLTDAPHRVRALGLGAWIAISGAAFTTGLGARTSLGTSLLLGLLNVRLGYWWDCGLSLKDRKHVRTNPGWIKSTLEHLCEVLPVQTYLLEEMLGRFHGPVWPRWYLSDGGHFENTAAYELIRRRVPFIIVSDGGADGSCHFGDLANLVRRVRVDFNAEIEFLDQDQLKALVHPALAEKVIGTREDLVPNGETKRARSLATLAWVRYPGDPRTPTPQKEGEFPGSLLLLIKPGLTEDMPVDVANYQCTHPDFPNESTFDQYFDEAQWESYRKLGEEIARRVFAVPPSQVALPGATTSPPAPGWWYPALMAHPALGRPAQP